MEWKGVGSEEAWGEGGRYGRMGESWSEKWVMEGGIGIGGREDWEDMKGGRRKG